MPSPDLPLLPELERVLDVLRCVECGSTAWRIQPDDAGVLVICPQCSSRHVFAQGILHMAIRGEHPDVKREQEAVRPTEMNPHLGGWTERVERTTDVPDSLKSAYLSLPFGDGSFRFQEPGYFTNVAHFAPEFAFIVDRLPAHGRLLDLGADATWSTARLARRGFACIALDITDHLTLGDLYHSVGPSYGRVIVDMHEPAFRDGAFDVITAFNAMHHSARLAMLADRIAAMLTPGGVLAFVEPYVQNDAQRQQFGSPQLDAGINENIYTLEEWHHTFGRVGLRLETFAIGDAFCALYRKSGHEASGLEIANDGTAAGYYDAAVTASSAHERVRVNQPAEVRVSVANRGVAGWASRGPYPVRLSYHVVELTPTGRTTIAFDNERTLLPAFVGPGDTSDHVVHVRFERPGTYEVEFDLVHEARCWFADRGGRTGTIVCEVVA